MTTAVTQSDISYINYCQKRLTADLRTLEKRSTLAFAAGQASATLPAEAIRVLGLFVGGTPLRPVSVREYMQLTSLGGDAGSAVFYVIVGRTLYVYPQPAVAESLDIFYSYRSATADSGSTFEVSGEAERLLERLVSAYKMIDDGQPELWQAELGTYIADVAKLRRRFVRGKGGGTRMRLYGRGKLSA